MDEEQPSAADPTDRRPYTPPSLQKVLLRPDEAVLGFCKTNNKSGPLHGSCKAIGPCSTQGS